MLIKLFFTRTWAHLVIFVRNQNMKQGKINSTRFFLPSLLLTLFALQVVGAGYPLTVVSSFPATDTTNPGDSLIPKTDTINISKVSKDSLDAPVVYEAEDSMVLDVPTKTIILYGKAKIDYKDIKLNSQHIKVEQSNQSLTAYPGTDSTGAYVNRPHFVQGENIVDSDTMRYNFKNGKGLAKGSYTHSGEMFVYSEKSKRLSNNTFFGYNSNLTTCNLDTPHFAFKTKKIKVVNNKWGFSGPVHPEFEGVPVPVWLPFGIYPLSRGRHSGFLPPTFAPTESFGLGLTGIGWYQVMNDHWDVTTRADIYSYGSWNLYVSPTYRKRYKYQGGLSFTLRNTRLNFPGDPDYTKNQSFGLTWSHVSDTRARPGVNFNANVNFVSSKNFNFYNPLLPNSNFNNQFSSSIAYSKTWQNKPFSLTITANHSQNTQSKIINLDLPNIGFTVNNIFPFQKKEFAGTPKWYEKISIGYQGLIRSTVAFYDSAFDLNKLIDTLQWGAQHNFPLSVSLPPVGAFQISPSISYQERWYAQTFVRSWNDARQKVDTTITKGFYRAGLTSFGIGVNTQIFGTYQFKDSNSRIVAIRHVIRPSFGLSYQPDLNSQNYYTTQVNTQGGKARFNKFEGSLYGPYAEGVTGGFTFGVDNMLEMKVRDKKDSTKKDKKVSLIDGFGFNGSYNLLADSMNLSNISFNLRSNLFSKLSMTGGFTLIPYILDSLGRPTSKYAWQKGKFSLGSVDNMFLSFSTSFRSKEKKEKEKTKQQINSDNNYPLTIDEQQRMLEQVQKNPGEYADFNVPWSLTISYSLRINRQLRSDYKSSYYQVTQNANMSGDFNFAPKWKFGGSAFLDITNKEIQNLTFFATRDMHCWQLSINVTPVGLWRSFNITINPKAALLRDLRINRTRVFQGF